MEKSNVDFRGTVKIELSISFDCKESEDERGLPLKNIEPHQIEYIRNTLSMGEVGFIFCYMKRKLIIIDKDTGEELERVEFTGGYNIAVTNMHDEDAKGFDIVC